MGKRRAKGEGSIYFNESKGLWIGKAIIGTKPDGSPRYKEVSARVKMDVAGKVRHVEGKAVVSADAERMLTGEYLERWLVSAKPGVGLASWESYERCVRIHLKPRIGGIRLGALTPLLIEEMFASMAQEGVSGGNGKKVSEVLSTALEAAVRLGMLRGNPASSARKPKPVEKETVPFTPAEVRAILQASEGHALHAMVVLAFGTGMRLGELFALDWDAVDLEGKTVTVRRSVSYAGGKSFVKEPKSKRGKRVIDIPSFCVVALTRHKEKVSEGLVFCTRTGGLLLKSNFAYTVWKPLTKLAGVSYRKFHTARHTHISELLADGVSVVDVARRVGDRPEVILKVYAHYVRPCGDRITAKLDALYG